MTDQPFVFEYDRTHAVLKVRLAGAWTMATLEQYRAELASIVIDETPYGAVTRLLVDLRAQMVQPREVAEGMQKTIAIGQRSGRRPLRVAIVHPASMLTTLQARRVTENDDGAFLTASEDDALAWLVRA